MWEIYADGADPYPGMTNLVTRAKIFCDDYRMTFPEVIFKCFSDEDKNHIVTSRLPHQPFLKSL